MVIPDADVWIDFLNQRAGSDDLERLVDDAEAILVGPVLSEILRGLRDPEERSRTLHHLNRVTYAEVTREIWTLAGNIAADLDSQGFRIPMPDVYIAALALAGDHEVYSRDRHFDRIPGLRLYQPEGDSDA